MCSGIPLPPSLSFSLYDFVQIVPRFLLSPPLSPYTSSRPVFILAPLDPGETVMAGGRSI